MNPGIARGLEPKTRAFVTAVEAQSGPPIDRLSYEAARALLSGVQSDGTAGLPARVEDTSLPTGPAGTGNVPEHIFAVGETGNARNRAPRMGCACRQQERDLFIVREPVDEELCVRAIEVHRERTHRE